MSEIQSVEVDGGVVTVVFTDRFDGDFRPLPPGADATSSRPSDDREYRQGLARRRLAIVDRPWTWLRQMHSARVVYVAQAGAEAGVAADGALTTAYGCPLAVTTADCAPLVLVAEAGFAVVHAGWRGLVAGIVDEAASQLRAVGGSPVAALLGPCITVGAYEFGGDDLVAVAAALGEGVRGETDRGTPALDVPAAVSVACERADWIPPSAPVPCTSDRRWYSHRTRADQGRQAAVAWLSPSGGRRLSPVPRPDHGGR